MDGQIFILDYSMDFWSVKTHMLPENPQLHD